jgi:hypothetical protein
MDLGLIVHTFNSSDPEEKRECAGTAHCLFMQCRKVFDAVIM